MVSCYTGGNENEKSEEEVQQNEINIENQKC